MLTAEQRKKLMDATGWVAWPFDGKLDNARYRDLTQTTARLIHESKEPLYSMGKTRLVTALATGDTNAIEELCYELLDTEAKQ